jgi:hypothetical protein
VRVHTGGRLPRRGYLRNGSGRLRRHRRLRNVWIGSVVRE